MLPPAPLASLPSAGKLKPHGAEDSWPQIRTVCAHHLNGRITKKAKRKVSRWFL